MGIVRRIVEVFLLALDRLRFCLLVRTNDAPLRDLLQSLDPVNHRSDQQRSELVNSRNVMHVGANFFFFSIQPNWCGNDNHENEATWRKSFTNCFFFIITGPSSPGPGQGQMLQ